MTIPCSTGPGTLPTALFVLLVGAAQQTAAQGTAAEVEAGRQLYMTNGCYSCHGTVGQGGERGSGPRIAADPHPFEAFKALVRHPRELMPRLDVRFVNDEQLLSLHRYLASIPKGPSARDIPQLQLTAR